MMANRGKIRQAGGFHASCSSQLSTCRTAVSRWAPMPGIAGTDARWINVTCPVSGSMMTPSMTRFRYASRPLKRKRANMWSVGKRKRTVPSRCSPSSTTASPPLQMGACLQCSRGGAEEALIEICRPQRGAFANPRIIVCARVGGPGLPPSAPRARIPWARVGVEAL